jgi:hypothetical protein
VVPRDPEAPVKRIVSFGVGGYSRVVLEGQVLNSEDRVANIRLIVCVEVDVILNFEIGIIFSRC